MMTWALAVPGWVHATHYPDGYRLVVLMGEGEVPHE